jgi:hypothetical protein
VTIGNGVKVQNNISIYEGVEIEDDVFLGPSMVFTNVVNPRSFIVRKTEYRKTLIKRGASPHFSPEFVARRCKVPRMRGPRTGDPEARRPQPRRRPRSAHARLGRLGAGGN